MNAKLAISLAVSALILLVGGFFSVLSRLDKIESHVEAPAGPEGRPPAAVPTAGDGRNGEKALNAKEARAKLNFLIQAIEEIQDEAYDYSLEQGQDLYELKREVRQLKATLRRIAEGLSRGGGVLSDIGWGLKPKGAPLDEATAKAYRQEAQRFGIEVEEGKVTVRGFLNLSPRVEMPIEYFVTRYPEAGHETLVHLIGNKDLKDLREQPLGALKGLATALYKGLVAAGFEQGDPTHPDPASDPKDPRWVLASGDTVYIAARYELGGVEHIALATDWVLDPQTQQVLPPDAFRFTGSARGEDPDTGDAILAAEMMGGLVSVWPNAASIAEVALESSLRNDYAYNFTRIPKHEKGEMLYLDVIFSKTPVEPKGDGAKEIVRPEAVGNDFGK